MDFKDLQEKIRQKIAVQRRQKEEPAYLHTVAWFHYLGILRHNKILPHRHEITLKESLEAGKLEPRILELLPAILLVLPQALKFTADEIPSDLKDILECIRARHSNKEFRGIPAQDYLHWLNAPVMELAKRRLEFHRMPRRSPNKTHAIGEVIRRERLRLSLTQKELAQKYHLSLRVIRDLEQGHMNASLKATKEILKVFDCTLTVG
jgi:ribosome-binding protein aMBF1 (putative translation factor)